MYWLVFNKQTKPQGMIYPQGREGGGYAQGPDITTIQPVGIWRSDRAEDACQAAARKTGLMGTYFAIEGTPWGVDLIDAPDGTTELGVPEPDDEHERRLRALERSVLDRDVPA